MADPDNHDGEDSPAASGLLDLGVLTEDLGFQINITRRAVSHWLRKHRPKNVPREPSGFYATLMLIGANPGITQREIADSLFFDAPNLASILGKLEKGGLVQRVRDPVDRRRAHLTLTAAGIERCEAARETSRSVTSSIAQGMSEDEIRELQTLLVRLQQSLRG